MPLIIPQGKQDTTQDNKFNPIVAQDVMLEITDLKLAKTQANTLEVTLRILEGQHKNRFIFDRVTFDPNNTMSWKYRQLRKCAGVPYQEGEPTAIDIEALLLHKAVKADLSIRKGKNRDGEEQEYQDIKYKVVNTQASTPTKQPGTVFQSTPTQTQAAKPAAPKATTQVEQVQPKAPTSFDAPADLDINDESDWD